MTVEAVPNTEETIEPEINPAMEQPEEETIKAPTKRELFQKEYNQLCAEWGHNVSQMKVFQRRNETIDARIEKILKTVQNMPQEKGEK